MTTNLESETDPLSIDDVCEKISNRSKAFFVPQTLFDDPRVQESIHDAGYTISFNTHSPDRVAVYLVPKTDADTYEELKEFVMAEKSQGFMAKDLLDDRPSRKLLRKSGYTVFTSALGVHIIKNISK